MKEDLAVRRFKQTMLCSDTVEYRRNKDLNALSNPANFIGVRGGSQMSETEQ